MWAMGVFDLGLCKGWMSELTPAQFWALVDRKAIDIRRDQFNSAMISSTIANANRAKGDRVFTALDFMPVIAGDENQAPEAKSPEVLRAKLKTLLSRSGKHGSKVSSSSLN